MNFLRTQVGAVLAYSLCSSTMLLVNKVAMVDIPYPAAVSNVQFIFAVWVVYTCKHLGMIKVDEFEMKKIRPFFWYVLSFTTSIYCNMKALGESNVETVIVFRSCSPVIVAVIEWIFMGRELPSKRSTASLFVIALGSAGYVASDKAFSLNGWKAYGWVLAYLALLCFNMSYGKYLIQDIKMVDPVWGSVLYNNALSIVPTLIIGYIGGEDPVAFITGYSWDAFKISVVVLSCVIGTAISWTGFNCRKALTATAYTLVGVLNKLLTVLLNVLMFDDHASMLGIGALLLTILGGTFYQQAPMRKSYIAVPQSDPAGGNTKAAKATESDIEDGREVEMTPPLPNGNSNAKGRNPVKA
eukprot:gb/GEZN01009348.1/.p1 GENE.gb/GEZN01009348.1/~~gb/GEZN01009348.1/.p1  ORF type:complete len:355 (-),score=50.97 gb/GEZN01009348.1/:229-1293(-)